ncbi:hypothetical protein WJX84_006883 [Apatococcus fuscideae]|uniref:Uncharacterized protein n=1 Tax=Apatococcus fuscideae TaxID=2026836 RepID=A0AAW1SYK9_9CHLO
MDQWQSSRPQSYSILQNACLQLQRMWSRAIQLCAAQGWASKKSWPLLWLSPASTWAGQGPAIRNYGPHDWQISGFVGSARDAAQPLSFGIRVAAICS